MKPKINILRFVYRAFLTGFPFITYNPFNTNTFQTSFDVQPYSTYVNYKLDNSDINYLNNYLFRNTNNLKLEPVSIGKEMEKNYFMSINIYNCTSPLFSFIKKEPITRCEINTYVKNEDGEIGTLILSYASNMLSMDPINIFKKASNLTNFDYVNNIIYCRAINSKFNFSINFNVNKNDKLFFTDKNLHVYTDNIFYRNGIIDKLYYDSSLINSLCQVPSYYNNLYFKFEDLILTNPHSIFYFKNKISFSGTMWENLKEFKID
jgi:hypothetical protein